MSWRAEVNIKKHFGHEPVEEVPGLIADELERCLALAHFAPKFRALSGHSYREESVNALLSRLYDEADREWIWLGV